ncbi:MAG: hypothetical protein GTN67_15035 [Hydrotalea flava]|uniref:hypothetical protein n=1 Tax=Hydrotalea TaxID=1004300 RepID=UPI00094282E2|nr:MULTISPECIES: hypothetical protein [Hydrotalea]MBY0346833.1 hypothetical protein [Hydrotalea flava]NIM36585.1 hypothetical protein [Hydrotalea flava]NIM39445.1 hypothetical protein [Hydrotalea flava]NIN04634.1 hypothetical protein [Hydrotalea flava]NIN16306.1 hypothetical protein [Hydrotalea flava]
MPQPTSIRNLSELNEAIHQLKQQKKEMESTIAFKWEILQEQYPVLIKNTIFKKYPILKKGNILITLLGIPAIQQNVEKWLLKAGTKAENLVDKWIDYLLNKKESNTSV